MQSRQYTLMGIQFVSEAFGEGRVGLLSDYAALLTPKGDSASPLEKIKG